MEAETIADIAAELRERAWKWTKDPELAKALEQYADRIENAAELVYQNGRNDGYDAGYSDGYSEGESDTEMSYEENEERI